MFARNTAHGGITHGAANPPRAFHTVLDEDNEQMTAGSSAGRRSKDDFEDTAVKKCETMDKLNESLQGKIDRAGPKATTNIELCVDKLTKFKDLPDVIFTTALERFHSHSTRTIFLRLDDENKFRWLYTVASV
ncbi:hypothetical protein Salat_2413600 [Sesamum alatum]|uniref:Uncharacterized protein n=1 Tax=Sesamum alatum TaxID=300844 RepID=A0AAE1XY04_9LAMI|nr:hypothetical protein Salat_2413600 [Sesamum alatum]